MPKALLRRPRGGRMASPGAPHLAAEAGAQVTGLGWPQQVPVWGLDAGWLPAGTVEN